MVSSDVSVTRRAVPRFAARPTAASCVAVRAGTSRRRFTSACSGTRLPIVVAVPQGGGLGVVFDPALDGAAWPSLPSATRSASAGFAWLGPLGLLGRLELELGLSRAQATQIERAAELAGRLGAVDGFWSRSFAVDALATAAKLLADRDSLAMCGWRGEPASARLAALWAIAANMRPGEPDRLHAVLAALAHRRIELAAVELAEPIEAFPPLWREVLGAMERCGARVAEAGLTTAPARGDLAAARVPGFVPAGDGSLQLVRPHGPLAAAEMVAAILAAAPSLAGVVLIAPEDTVDAALARHGLPRSGAEVPRPGSAALVRLCVEAAFQPMDAADLHALVCADPGPVPRRIAWRLVAALRRFPGRGSTEWRDALAAGLASIEEHRRTSVADRLAALLAPVVDPALPLAVVELRKRMGVLVDWACTQAATRPGVAAVIALATRLLDVAALRGVDYLDRGELLRLCAALDQERATGPAAEIGFAAVHEPAAMLGPARVVIWWGFVRDRAPQVPRLRLTARERIALSGVGVRVPEGGAEMAHEARRWRRPLMQASDSVVLVCPRFDETGAPAHPHPLWDELVAGMRDPSHAMRLVVRDMSVRIGAHVVVARRVQATPRAVPEPVETVRVARGIALRERESASSIEKLLGCSLAYALHYHGKLHPGLASGPADPTPLLYGQLSHLVLARLFATGAIDPDAAAAGAAAMFDDELPLVAETLWLAQHQAERASVRRAIVESARTVATLVTKSGATIRGLELMLEGTFGRAAVGGRADLVLAGPDHVIDFKWGTSANRERLRTGAAVQLAIYAELARTGASLPGIAFLILGTQRILAGRGTNLSGASVPGVHSAEEMSDGARSALDARSEELSVGRLMAPGALQEAPTSQLAEGIVRLGPPCAHCGLGGICGRRGRS